VNREVHARFCEGLGVKFPRATRLSQYLVCLYKQEKCKIILLIHAFSSLDLSAKIAILRFSIVTTAYRSVDFSVVKKVATCTH
jgi:hypothetical protein